MKLDSVFIGMPQKATTVVKNWAEYSDQWDNASENVDRQVRLYLKLREKKLLLKTLYIFKYQHKLNVLDKPISPFSRKFT